MLTVSKTSNCRWSLSESVSLTYGTTIVSCKLTFLAWLCGIVMCHVAGKYGTGRRIVLFIWLLTLHPRGQKLSPMEASLLATRCPEALFSYKEFRRTSKSTDLFLNFIWYIFILSHLLFREDAAIPHYHSMKPLGKRHWLVFLPHTYKRQIEAAEGDTFVITNYFVANYQRSRIN